MSPAKTFRTHCDREGRHARRQCCGWLCRRGGRQTCYEPSDWLLPTREHLGAVLMRAGRAADAEKVFRADLERNRQHPRSLFGVWKALERQGKTAQSGGSSHNL
jgi:hypothetical protein